MDHRIGFHGKILTGNPWVFTMKNMGVFCQPWFSLGVSGSNFPFNKSNFHGWNQARSPPMTLLRSAECGAWVSMRSRCFLSPNTWRWQVGQMNGRSPGSNTRRYVSTICLAIFCGDIHLHRPEKLALYMLGTSILGSWNSHWSESSIIAQEYEELATKIWWIEEMSLRWFRHI